jgi:thiamine-monophosphate kinase
VSGPDRSEPEMRSSPEFDLIARVRERMAATVTASASAAAVRVGIGDDAAVIVPLSGRGASATSVDALVDGIGFRRRWCPPGAVGRKALGAALSDLAAMGATPGEAYVWLGMPEDLDPEEALELCDGLASLAEQHGVAVLGGDLTRAPALSVSVTAVGYAPAPEELIGRAGASTGDALCATGTFGGAAAGLMLLEHPRLEADVEQLARDACVSRQLDPEPLFACGAALAGAGARAMIDVSDGLGADAGHLAAASGLGIEIELDRVPVAAGVREVAAAAGRDPHELIVSGGEDYELLCAVPRVALGECIEAVEECGTTLTEIGRFVSGGSVRVRLPGGRSVPASGHDHLRFR